MDGEFHRLSPTVRIRIRSPNIKVMEIVGVHCAFLRHPPDVFAPEDAAKRNPNCVIIYLHRATAAPRARGPLGLPPCIQTRAYSYPPRDIRTAGMGPIISSYGMIIVVNLDLASLYGAWGAFYFSPPFAAPSRFRCLYVPGFCRNGSAERPNYAEP